MFGSTWQGLFSTLAYVAILKFESDQIFFVVISKGLFSLAVLVKRKFGRSSKPSPTLWELFKRNVLKSDVNFLSQQKF